MLKGKIAMVTGASRGIGRAIAIKLASLGATVVVNARANQTSNDLSDTLEAIKEFGNDCAVVYGDVGSFTDCEKMVQEVIAKYEKIDILINNAGITRDGMMLKMSEDNFDSVIETNLKGVFNMCRHASGFMFRKRFGKIINISSVVGLIGNAGQANYAASKAGVIGLTKSLAKELAPVNVTVNAVCPGFIETAMTDKLSDKVKENLLNAIPMKRFGLVDDVANLVVFLVSENSNYITGQAITVDGGMVI